MKKDLLFDLRSGKSLTRYQQLCLIIRLSLPAIMAQLSSIVMQYIDASMVGRLGSECSASIGLVSSTTWLFGGLCTAVVTGFTVQVAQNIGAQKFSLSRNIMKMGILFAFLFGVLLMGVGALISSSLPLWLGGKDEILKDSSNYFLIYALSLPIVQLNNISSGMLQASGNMRVPSILHVFMCALDVIFNLVLIFDEFFIFGIRIYGFGLGVLGAALGTALSQVVIAFIMLFFLLFRSEMLKLRKSERFNFDLLYLGSAIKIAFPVAVEQVITGGAYIAFTKIVSPLGNIAIAANSFAITAESLCYMPGYGIGSAATTLIGQSIGAKRHDLTRKLAWLTTLFGMLIMSVSGVLLYFLSPFMMALLSPEQSVIKLGTEILRIEAFAEPFYAASIIALGVFRGAGDTFAPSIMNFCSMWLVRIPLAALLASSYGLQGVWFAMCFELCIRGIIFLIRLSGKKWSNKTLVK